MGRLTDVQLQALVRNGQVIAGKSDGDGLTFTVSKSRTASWELRYRYGGKQRWLTLGRYPDMSLKEARIRALKERVRVADGVDVVADKRRARIALANAKTIAELCADYMERAAPALKQATRKELRRYLDKDILPNLGHYRIEEVTAAEVVALVDKIGRRSASVARGAFSILSIVFKHGLAKHLAKSNPCAGLRVAAIIGAKRPVRAKVSLTENELRTIVAKLPQIGRANALAIKIILATCTRKGELTAAKWEHVDLEQRLWTIPSENSKNAKAFVIPLVAVVAGWFLELRELACGSPWVRPGRNCRAPLSPMALNAALSRLKTGVRHFTVHDLRRTARSHLGALGVDVIIAEKCLNHTLGGLIDIYDRGDYLKERRAALELWASFLVCCEEGRPWNVEPLRVVA